VPPILVVPTSTSWRHTQLGVAGKCSWLLSKICDFRFWWQPCRRPKNKLLTSLDRFNLRETVSVFTGLYKIISAVESTFCTFRQRLWVVVLILEDIFFAWYILMKLTIVSVLFWRKKIRCFLQIKAYKSVPPGKKCSTLHCRF